MLCVGMKFSEIHIALSFSQYIFEFSCFICRSCTTFQIHTGSQDGVVVAFSPPMFGESRLFLTRDCCRSNMKCKTWCRFPTVNTTNTIWTSITCQSEPICFLVIDSYTFDLKVFLVPFDIVLMPKFTPFGNLGSDLVFFIHLVWLLKSLCRVFLGCKRQGIVVD